MGSRNALWVEVWGLHLGIKLAWDLQLNRVIFELGSEVVNIVNKGRTSIAFLQPLLEEFLFNLYQPD